jgi:membrane protein DedA with SNARE-associated domain/surfactin synthase thioesterase subunit
VPDLPGFGHSTRRIPDYSIRAHAGSILELLDELDIEKAHVVGFSMGGGVALELAHRAPGRVRSLTLLSAIGVQELELLGGYRLNHAIHALQLAALVLLHEGTPHFGLLDGLPLDIPYARNFFDSDQRPLRGILASLEVPTLIIHGLRDVLVPVAAAREHHRLVPQSELHLFEENHFMVFRGGSRLAVPLTDFLERVERGEAPRRSQARADRIARAHEPFRASDLPPARGFTLVTLMILIALATFASEDLASIGTGLLVAQGRIGFFAGTVACVAGILAGDVAIYLGGRLLGRPWLGRAPLRWIVSATAVERGSRWFASRGPSIIFASRFLPGTRVATYFAAGLLETGFWRFLLYLGLAVVIWVPLIVGAAALVGVRLFEWFEIFSRFALPGIVGLAIFGWLLLRAIRTLFTRRGRRMLVGRWRRLRHWEFWPPWVFYPPVVLRIVGLALHHRSLTVFTAANPGIHAGGFIGESKSEILSRLDPRFVARWTLIRADLGADQRRAAFDTFRSRFELELPVALKPDVGERGSGVLIARTDADVDRYLARQNGDLIVQEFIPGVELGVFYVKKPDESSGRVFSITTKRLPVVAGDGEKSLEELILADERAVAMAKIYLDGLSSELDRVPGLGEKVRLVEIGTHCRGAVFENGIRLRTPQLERTIEMISRSFEGFFFGRYDMKAPSWEAFKRGENITVIELNGVTSEATHIYDSTCSLGDAYRVLFRQWQLAFEIGARNAELGAPVSPVRELLRLLRKPRGSGG